MANKYTMGTITTLSLLFLTCTTTFLSGQAHGPAADLCAGSTYTALCRSVVGRQHNPYAAAEATINRLISETKKAKTSAARLPQKDSSVCKEMYDEVLDSLGKGLQSLKSRDAGGLNVNLSAVLSSAEACKDSFDEMGKGFPLAKQNELIKHLASTALHIATKIP